MSTLLFWLAIPIGFLSLPVSIIGYGLLPFAIISLFNEFAAPRFAILALFGINLICSLPPVSIWCQRTWLLLNPQEDNPKHALLLGSQGLASALSVTYLSSNGWISASRSSWLLTAYWFICLAQLWGKFFIILTAWLISLNTKDRFHVIALQKRQSDTWLTCLLFLIPFYIVYYIISRRTIAPLVSFGLLSLPVAIITYLSYDVNSSLGYFSTVSAMVYTMSPVTVGIGAMKAKRYGSMRLKQISSIVAQ